MPDTHIVWAAVRPDRGPSLDDLCGTKEAAEQLARLYNENLGPGHIASGYVVLRFSIAQLEDEPNAE
jgi:hypothetical protein